MTFLLCLALFAVEPLTVGAGDWPWWRGPTRDGVANPRQSPPVEWSATENVLWSAPVPGRGHGSPTVVGDHVYLATADEQEQTQSVLCYDRNTGKLLWRKEVHKGGFLKGGNKKRSEASSTVCCDGTRLFINFPNRDAIYTTCLDREGKQLWQTRICKYVVHQGYGSSPAVFGPLVLVSADNKSGGAVAGLERDTGKIVWKHERPKTPNYASPILMKIAGKERMLLTGCNLVSCFDPLTGKLAWQVKGATTECVTSIVSDGERVFTSGGYPRNHIAAMRADGSGKIAWENGTRVYVPSMFVREGHLYAVTDAGVAMCWKSDTGKEMWRGRLGGTFSGSAVLVGDTAYVTNEAAETFLFKASPTGFKLLGKNKLGQHCMATPAICGGRVYLRVATRVKGERQERLWCLGAK